MKKKNYKYAKEFIVGAISNAFLYQHGGPFRLLFQHKLTFLLLFLSSSSLSLSLSVKQSVMIVLQATPPICFISFLLTMLAAGGYISFHRFVNRRGFCALAAVPLMLPPSPSSSSTSPSTPWQGPCHFSLSLYSPFCAQWALHFLFKCKNKGKKQKRKSA